MKTVVVFLAVTVTIFSAFGLKCRWTPCVKTFDEGQSICNQYDYGTYVGIKNSSNECKWNSEHNLCCIPDENSECKWSECNRSSDDAYACSKSFGPVWIPNGDTDDLGCPNFSRMRRCCN